MVNGDRRTFCGVDTQAVRLIEELSLSAWLALQARRGGHGAGVRGAWPLAG